MRFLRTVALWMTNETQYTGSSYLTIVTTQLTLMLARGSFTCAADSACVSRHALEIKQNIIALSFLVSLGLALTLSSSTLDAYWCCLPGLSKLVEKHPFVTKLSQKWFLWSFTA